jgi:hypothetical protein
MYWRFRYITRNRHRFQSWMRQRRPSTGYRPRGAAAHVSRRSGRRTWLALIALIVLLTALSALAHRVYINPALVYAVGTLIVVGSIYWALRGL